MADSDRENKDPMSERLSIVPEDVYGEDWKEFCVEDIKRGDISPDRVLPSPFPDYMPLHSKAEKKADAPIVHLTDPPEQIKENQLLIQEVVSKAHSIISKLKRDPRIKLIKNVRGDTGEETLVGFKKELEGTEGANRSLEIPLKSTQDTLTFESKDPNYIDTVTITGDQVTLSRMRYDKERVTRTTPQGRITMIEDRETPVLVARAEENNLTKDHREILTYTLKTFEDYQSEEQRSV